MYLLKIPPMGKPRMTKADAWKKRPSVLRYWKWCDALRALADKASLVLPDCGVKLIFWVAMPASWTKKKRDLMRGQPHQQVPDGDNMVKALTDALNKKDQSLWQLCYEKRWADDGAIEIITGVQL